MCYSFTAQIEQVEQELEKLKENCRQYEKIIAAKDAAIADLERTLEAVRKEHVQKTGEVEENIKTIAAHENLIGKGQQALDELEKKLKKMCKTIEQKDELIAQLNKSSGTISGDMNKSQKQEKQVKQTNFAVNLCCFDAETNIKNDSNEVPHNGKLKHILSNFSLIKISSSV